MIFLKPSAEFLAYHNYEQSLPTFVGRVETVPYNEDETILDGCFLMDGDQTPPVYIRRAPVVKLNPLKDKHLVFKDISDQEYFKWMLSNTVRDSI
jgi:hypothetical protein